MTLLGISLWAFLFSACVAQQADLARVQKDLEDQISKLNKEKSALQGEISRDREEAESLKAQQDAAMKDFRRSRAEIRQELKAVREADLTKLTGDIDEINYRLQKLQQSLEAQRSETSSHFQALETQIDEQETTNTQQGSDIAGHQTQLTELIKQIDQDSEIRNQQVTDFQGSLSSFKESMAGLGTQMVQETERVDQAIASLTDQLAQEGERTDQAIAGLTNQQTERINLASAELRSQIDGINGSIANIESQQASLQSIVDTQKTALSTQATNIQEVSESTTQLREALNQSGTLVGGQVTSLETDLNQLEAHVDTLTGKLNTDTDALRTYLEQDVKASINAMTESVANQQRPLVARLDTLQGQFQGLQSQTQGLEVQTQNQASHVQELTQSLLALKEKQEFVGGLLGERGDKIMQESGQIRERIGRLESHQSDLTQKMETNNQSTVSHLAEVNSSVTSVTQALENTSATLATRLDNQEQQLNSLSSTIQTLQQAKGDLEANLSRLETTTQSSSDMRDVANQMNARLQELEVHQSALVGKLDADGQSMNTHLAKVNEGINSVANALKQVEEDLRSKINNQERTLNQALTTVQSAQGSSEMSQANLTHLNQLTQTINQLRDVVDTIGTKLGGRVDQHESRLAELAKRVNLLSGKKR